MQVRSGLARACPAPASPYRTTSARSCARSRPSSTGATIARTSSSTTAGAAVRERGGLPVHVLREGRPRPLGDRAARAADPRHRRRPSSTEVEANELDPSTRTMRGEPLLVWGEYDEDALRVRTLDRPRRRARRAARVGEHDAVRDPAVVGRRRSGGRGASTVTTARSTSSRAPRGTARRSAIRRARTAFELVDHDVGRARRCRGATACRGASRAPR